MQLRSSTITSISNLTQAHYSGTTTGLVDPSQAHYRQNNITVKLLGAGDNGTAYAAISKADANMIIAKHCGSAQALHDKIRSELQAVKFAKETNLEGDLSNEVKFLTKAVTVKHPRITPALDSHLDGKTQYSALPFCSGGNLQRFIDKHGASLPVAFVWHVGVQLTEAVCFLLQHPGVAHCDIWSENTLLRPTTDADADSAFGNYPDAVVADFGRAIKIEPDEPLAVQQWLVRQQLNDIAQVASTLQFMRRDMRWARLMSPNRIHCPACFTSCREPCHECCTDAKSATVLDVWLAQFVTIATTSDNIAQGLAFLEGFAAAARQQRAENYRPLPDTVSADLAAVKITDNEIAIALAQLQQ